MGAVGKARGCRGPARRQRGSVQRHATGDEDPRDLITVTHGTFPAGCAHAAGTAALHPESSTGCHGRAGSTDAREACGPATWGQATTRPLSPLPLRRASGLPGQGRTSSGDLKTLQCPGQTNPDQGVACYFLRASLATPKLGAAAVQGAGGRGSRSSSREVRGGATAGHRPAPRARDVPRSRR